MKDSLLAFSKTLVKFNTEGMKTEINNAGASVLDIVSVIAGIIGGIGIIISIIMIVQTDTNEGSIKKWIITITISIIATMCAVGYQAFLK